MVVEGDTKKKRAVREEKGGRGRQRRKFTTNMAKGVFIDEGVR